MVSHCSNSNGLPPGQLIQVDRYRAGFRKQPGLEERLAWRVPAQSIGLKHQFRT